MKSYEYVTNVEMLSRIASEMENAGIVGVDIETTSMQPFDLFPKGQLRLVQIDSGTGIYVIDLFKTGTLGPVREVLNNPKIIKIFQNAKFDQKWLWAKYKVECWPVFDTWRASCLIHNGKKGFSHDLWSIMQRELGVRPESSDMQVSSWEGVLTENQIKYAAEDVVWLRDLRVVLKKQLEKKGLLKIAGIEFNSILPEAVTELNGFYLDEKEWRKLAEDNVAEKGYRHDNLIMKIPHPDGQLSFEGFGSGVNLDSSKQMLASFRRLGLNIEDTRETTLAMCAASFPIVVEFMEYRKISKSTSSFGLNFLKWINPVTSRIHTNYYPMLVSGRYSSADPNLQQIPRDKRFRACFKAFPGKKLLSADYAGIEMRIAAEISGDRQLAKIFSVGEDIHAATAAILLKKSPKEVTKKERQDAKPANFGFIYGMYPRKFVLYAQVNYGVTLTEEQATQFRENFFSAYAGIALWHKKTEREQQPKGLTRSIGGRLRYIEKENALNEYFNTPVQATGADALKTSLKLVYEGIKKFGDSCKLVHHVHDEIILEIEDDKGLEKEVTKVLHDAMMEGMETFMKKIPVVVEPKSGYNWAELK
jgi:DNA polymerase I-like protein with 3'-5' exonuclease and polymerase domains